MTYTQIVIVGTSLLVLIITVVSVSISLRSLTGG
jgi:hypothetical protein